MTDYLDIFDAALVACYREALQMAMAANPGESRRVLAESLAEQLVEHVREVIAAQV